MIRRKAVWCLFSFAALRMGVAVGLASDIPKTWTSVQWNGDMNAKAADIAAHGVEVIEVPVWNVKVCREALAVCRKHGLKGYGNTGEPSESSQGALAGKPYERAVMIGGAYRGLAIDRNLFSFAPGVHDIVIEPPVYSVRQPYAEKTGRSGHYFGGRVPLRAEVVVPLRPYDGNQHLKIIPCDLLPLEPGRGPENDTVTDAMRGSDEVVNRRLVRIRFDLTPYKDALLDKVGLAVYWASDTEGKEWKRGRGQMSVFSPHTRASAVHDISFRLERWAEANGGTFPADVICAIRSGDECYNVTGWRDCPAASYPLYGYSESGLAAFRKSVPAGLEPPRTWGFPEVYGEEAYGAFLYNYHKGCADLERAVVEAAHKIAPSVKVFRNTTRAGAWDYGNDHDGSGQELLTAVLDVVHLDPYPVAARYNASSIPFDMGYLSGLARRYGKPLLPWLQAHAYAPCGLAHVTPEQVARMWEQHKAFAPDGLMWLGYGGKAGEDSTMTFPYGNPESWEKAGEIHRAFREGAPLPRPVAKLAVLRHYTARALVSEAHDGSVRNPADALLREFVCAWSVDCGRAYDVFEIPPRESEEAKAKRDAVLKNYPLVVSSVPYGGARTIGADTIGKVYTRQQLTSWRQKFREALAADGTRMKPLRCP